LNINTFEQKSFNFKLKVSHGFIHIELKPCVTENKEAWLQLISQHGLQIKFAYTFSFGILQGKIFVFWGGRHFFSFSSIYLYIWDNGCKSGFF